MDEMNFVQAFRLGPAPRVAFVGAGGKTTAIFQLARDFLQIDQSSILVTTTTHLGKGQLSLADRHWMVETPLDLVNLERVIPTGVNLITGPGSGQDPERVNGLELPLMEQVAALAEANQVPLLVEADGSRMRPLKAPAEHEPAIPSFINVVVVVAGLSALGHTLAAEWVHRPNRFAALSGLRLGEAITVEGLARLLTHTEGGLKHIPFRARRIALLNQADTIELREQAKLLAALLLPAYDAVIVSARLKSADQENLRPGAVYETVAGVVLAAGKSSRFGQPKQLLLWQNQPMVRQVAQTALKAGLIPVIVVTGAYSDSVREALSDLGSSIQIIDNPDWEQGQSSSIKTALHQIPANAGSAVFLLVDQPQVPSGLIQALVEAHARSLLPLVAPRVGDRRANPVLFDRSVFPILMTLEGDMGGRQLFLQPDQFPVTWVNWNDPVLLMDVDTPEDYRRLLGLAGDVV